MNNSKLRFIDDDVWRHIGSKNYTDHDNFGFMNNISIKDASILITGSSHVYGTNLRKEHTWPIILQNIGHPIYSTAMGAWSVMQYALVARNYLGDNIRSFLVFIYLGFDVYASLRQSIETRDLSPFNIIQESDLKLSLDWSERTNRDKFLKEQAILGLSRNDALKHAYKKGHIDCFPVELCGNTWWLEPELRLKTMSLSSSYMHRALEVSVFYIKYIINICAIKDVRISFFLMPTKESVIAANLTGTKESNTILKELVSAERELGKNISMACESEGIDCVDLYDLYRNVSPSLMFDPTPLEGHPSKEGSEVLAKYISSFIKLNRLFSK